MTSLSKQFAGLTVQADAVSRLDDLGTLIDIDAMKAAFATTPMCQHTYIQTKDDGRHYGCAVTALVHYAGVELELIERMSNTMTGGNWVSTFVRPILGARYGIPQYMVFEIPDMFDAAPDERAGVAAVIARCEAHNQYTQSRHDLYNARVRELALLVGNAQVAIPAWVDPLPDGLTDSMDAFALTVSAPPCAVAAGA